MRSFVTISKHQQTTTFKTNFEKGQPSLDSRESMMRSLEDQGEIPLIVIVSVSVCGTILLLLNIVLISCFVHKKRQQKLLKDKEHSGSDASGSNVQKPTPPSEGT